MSTSAVSNNNATGNQSTTGTGYNLKPADFIKMMVTQLQNQDPLQPASNEQLLAQMSQIGQLQSSTDLQTALQGLTLQNQIGSAGNLIGKSVKGTDDNTKAVSGVVNSVRVQSNKVYLELDSGSELDVSKVSSIAPVAAPAAAAATGTAAKA